MRSCAVLNLDELQPGDRIVLRYRLAQEATGQPGPALSDVLGQMLAVTPVDITVQTRQGPVVVDRSAITHAKRVPPPPVRRPRGARG